MNVLKRTSARPGATFGLPILLSAAILVAHGSSVRAADTLGVEIAGLSNPNFSASDQAHAVQTIMAKKPSGIVIWPINPDELSPALEKAAEAGVKLALISRCWRSAIGSSFCASVERSPTVP